MQTFSAEAGSSSCTSCGGSSRSDSGSSSCSCVGNNRKYLVSRQECVCIDRYESATASNTQIDSDEDCSTTLASQCDDETDTSGNCVSSISSCDQACGINGGVRHMGMCQCNQMTLTNDACPESCRSNVYQYFFALDGSLQVKDQSGNLISTTNVSEISGLSGTFDYSSSNSNQIHSIGFSGYTFTSNYECSSQLSSIMTD